MCPSGDEIRTPTRSCRTRKRAVHVYSPGVAAAPAAATTALLLQLLLAAALLLLL